MKAPVPELGHPMGRMRALGPRRNATDEPAHPSARPTTRRHSDGEAVPRPALRTSRCCFEVLSAHRTAL
eukprot:718617-Prymnesium_polylepis.1